MEIFKLFESAMANIQPGHMNIKDLRRDQLLDHYDDATKSLKTLIQAKENEIAFRKDLIGMLEQSKVALENKLNQTKQNYQNARKLAPETLDLKGGLTRKQDMNLLDSNARSTTPPLPPPSATQLSAHPPNISGSKTLSSTEALTSHSFTAPSVSTTLQQAQEQSPMKNTSDLDIPMPVDNHDNRTSLDRRLSEFLKTFPNLTQAGLAPQTSMNDVAKPMPGYYTQQPPPPPIATAPNLMAMMRFPPPNMMPVQQQKVSQLTGNHENHDTADMELSDSDDHSIMPPMIASALQRGAGGKQGVIETPPTYLTGQQQFSNPIPYTPRLNALPFDPSIMDPSIRDSSSTSSRDKNSPGGSHRSRGSDSKHGSTKSRYSSSSSTSSHSSSRSKRR